MGITDEQRSEIAKLTEEADVKFSAAIEKDYSTVRIQLDEEWSDFLELLNPSDLELVERVIGQPFDWYSKLERPFQWRFKKYLVTNHPSEKKLRFVFGSDVPRRCDSEGRWMSEYSGEDLELLGFAKIDMFLLELLSTSFVQENLELSMEQSGQLRELLDWYRRKGIGIFTEHTERLKSLAADEGEILPGKLGELLTKEQTQVLFWMEYQARSKYLLRQKANVFSMANQLLKDAGSSNQQASRLSHSSVARLLVESQQDGDDRFNMMRPHRNRPHGNSVQRIAELRLQIRKELDRQIKEVLTLEQIDRFSRLTDPYHRAGQADKG